MEDRKTDDRKRLINAFASEDFQREIQMIGRVIALQSGKSRP